MPASYTTINNATNAHQLYMAKHCFVISGVHCAKDLHKLSSNLTCSHQAQRDYIGWLLPQIFLPPGAVKAVYAVTNDIKLCRNIMLVQYNNTATGDLVRLTQPSDAMCACAVTYIVDSIAMSYLVVNFCAVTCDGGLETLHNES